MASNSLSIPRDRSRPGLAAKSRAGKSILVSEFVARKLEALKAEAAIAPNPRSQTRS